LLRGRLFLLPAIPAHRRLSEESDQSPVAKVSEEVPVLLRKQCIVRHGSFRGLQSPLVLLKDVVISHLFEIAQALDLLCDLLILLFLREKLVSTLLFNYLIDNVHYGLHLSVECVQFFNVVRNLVMLMSFLGRITHLCVKVLQHWFEALLVLTRTVDELLYLLLE